MRGYVPIRGYVPFRDEHRRSRPLTARTVLGPGPCVVWDKQHRLPRLRCCGAAGPQQQHRLYVGVCAHTAPLRLCQHRLTAQPPAPVLLGPGGGRGCWAPAAAAAAAQQGSCDSDAAGPDPTRRWRTAGPRQTVRVRSSRAESESDGARRRASKRLTKIHQDCRAPRRGRRAGTAAAAPAQRVQAAPRVQAGPRHWHAPVARADPPAAAEGEGG
jgi:hypothetical protein